MPTALLLASLAPSLHATPAVGEPVWTQWRRPNRDAVSPGAHVLAAWRWSENALKKTEDDR